MHQKNLSFREAVFELGLIYQIDIVIEDEDKKNKHQQKDDQVALNIEELHKNLKLRFFELSESPLQAFLSHHIAEIGYLDTLEQLYGILDDKHKIPVNIPHNKEFYVLPFQTERGKILGFLFLKLEMESLLNIPSVVFEFSIFLSNEDFNYPIINFPQARKHIVDKSLVVATNTFDFFFLLKNGITNSVLLNEKNISEKLYQFFSKFSSNVYLLISENIKNIIISDKYLSVFVRWVKKDFFEKVKFYQSLDSDLFFKWIFESQRIKRKNNSDIEKQADTSKLKRVKKNEIKILEKTSSFYHRVLLHQSSGYVVEYLQTRGFDLNDIKEWNLGFCPRDSILTRALIKENSDLSLFLELGLLRLSQKNNEYYDFFYDRFIIPILNHTGECVALGGRIIDSSHKAPKYINSAESVLFSKSKILFNYHRATNAIVENGYAIIVEGFMDCMTLVKHGLRNVVAVMGTALTVEHLFSLAQITQRVILCFDSDSAGKQAVRKSFLSNLKFPDLILEVIELPSEKDPDEFVKMHGLGSFLNIIKNEAIVIYEYITKIIQFHSRDMEEFLLNLKEEFKSSEFSVQSKLGRHFSIFLIEKYNIKFRDIFCKNVNQIDAKSELKLIPQNIVHSPVWEIKNILEIKILFSFFYCPINDLPKKLIDVLVSKDGVIENEQSLFYHSYKKQISDEGKQIFLNLFSECRGKNYTSCLEFNESDILNFSEISKIFVAYIKRFSSVLISAGAECLIDTQTTSVPKTSTFDFNHVFSPKNKQFLRIQHKNVELAVAHKKVISLLVDLLLQLELSEIDTQLEQFSKTHFNQKIGGEFNALLHEREIRRVLLMS